jgi:hypothetical protein
MAELVSCLAGGASSGPIVAVPMLAPVVLWYCLLWRLRIFLALKQVPHTEHVRFSGAQCSSSTCLRMKLGRSVFEHWRQLSLRPLEDLDLPVAGGIKINFSGKKNVDRM